MKAHLHVEPDELAHVPVRERVLGAEDGRHLKGVGVEVGVGLGLGLGLGLG